MPVRLSIPRIVAVAVAALVLVPGAVFAHDIPGLQTSTSSQAHVSLAQRVQALATNVRVESLRTNAPAAVHGECVATVDVPGQGDSCRLARGMWGVVRADGTTASTHGPDVYAGTVPKRELTSPQAGTLAIAGDLTSPQPDSDFVSCTTDVRKPHTLLVIADPAPSDIRPIVNDPASIHYGEHADGYGVGLTDEELTATEANFRAAVRQASAFIQMQAVDEGRSAPDAARLRVLCDGTGQIVVKVAHMPALGADPDFSDIEAAVRGATPHVLANDDAGRIAAYYPVDVGSAAGQGWEVNDSRAVRDNASNGEDTFAVHYLTNAADNPHHVSDPDDVDQDTQLQTGGVRWDVILHEMMHNMGAVYSGAAPPDDSNGWGHCKSDDDIMCYAEHGIATVPTCVNTQLDCNGDTYFNAGSPVSPNWLANHWNAGSVENRYLDFGTRTASDIIAPTQPTNVVATSPSDHVLHVTWDASTDDQSSVEYLACYGTDEPTWCTLQRTTQRSASLGGVSAGATQVWVIAYDASDNPSEMSAPVAVNIAGTVSTPPTGTGTGTGTSNNGTSTTPTGGTETGETPLAPTAISVPVTGVGFARVEWSSKGVPTDTQYRVEINREDIGDWSFASPLYTADTATVHIPSGTAAKVRVYAQTKAGNTRSDYILLATGARGSNCSWSAGDSMPPTPVRKVQATSTGKSVKVTFLPATDPHGVCAIRVFTRINARGAWHRVATLAGTARYAVINSLERHTRLQVAIESIDANGNTRRSTVSATTR